MGTESCSIERVVRRYAYPRNGNAHNPTPYYAWGVSYKGRTVGMQNTLRDAQALAAEFMADPEW